MIAAGGDGLGRGESDGVRVGEGVVGVDVVGGEGGDFDFVPAGVVELDFEIEALGGVGVDGGDAQGGVADRRGAVDGAQGEGLALQVAGLAPVGGGAAVGERLLDGMRQFHTFRTVVRWLVAIVAAAFIAAIPTRLSSHDHAVGFPFTWYRLQEILTLGEQSSLSLRLLLLDIALVLAALVVLRIVIGGLVRPRGKDGSATNHAV